MKDEPKVSKANKNTRYFLWTLVGIIIFAGIAWAGTIITDTTVTTDSGTYTNITADRINEVLYVDAGNADDIQVKIDMCPSLGCKIIIPSGTYEFTDRITMADNIHLEGAGESTILNFDSGTEYITAEPSTNYLKISNLRINANNVSTSLYRAINFSGANIHNEVHLNNLHIFEARRAININATNIYIKDSFFDDVADGIWISKN